MSRELIPDQDNSFLELGRILEKYSYEGEEKGFNVGIMRLDLIRNIHGNIVIGEIKKSSRYEKPAIMQLAFYLYEMKNNGVIAQGELLIPKERKKVPVELTEELEEEIKQAKFQIESLILKEVPPPILKIKFCTNCAYREFCWA